MHLMSTQSFSEAILWLLDLADPSIQARALELLRTRLPSIKPTRRAEISPAVITVVERIRTILAKNKADSDGALETLEVIASSVFAEEDAVLAKTVPELMAVAKSAENPKSTRAVAIGILTKFTFVSPLFPRSRFPLTRVALQEPPRTSAHPSRWKAHSLRRRDPQRRGSG